MSVDGRGQRAASGLLELWLQGFMSHHMWGLIIELRSSGKTASALNC